MRRLIFVLLTGMALTAAALSPPPEPPALAPVADETLVLHFDGRVEVRLDADFNGDGDVDVAAVMHDEEAETRRLVVMLGYRDETDFGHTPLAEMAMDPYPLGEATLAVKNAVLIVDDLAGGTSAVASTYRFRWDRDARRMRLIGDDVMYYSRTNNHDSLEISTNRLTGLRLRKVGRLGDGDGDAAYEMQPETRERVDTAPIWMEDAPAPDATLGLGEP